jgi:single-strand DNA-binding protein
MNDLIAQVLRASQHRFIGRMARDPEFRSFDSGNCVCNGRILINKPGAKRDDGQEPDGFKLEIWGEKAQAFIDSGAKKGDLIDVTGRVKTETWTDRNTGEERRGLTIQVDQWAFAGQPRATALAQQATAPAPAAATPTWNSAPANSFSDQEIPF